MVNVVIRSFSGSHALSSKRSVPDVTFATLSLSLSSRCFIQNAHELGRLFFVPIPPPNHLTSMAVNNCDEGKPYLQGIVDGSCNLPVSSCFQLLKPGLDEVKPHCSLDVLPVLFKDASFPVRLKCPFHSSQGQDVYSISVLPDDGITNPPSESQIAFLSFLEVSNPFKSQIYSDSQLNCKNCIGLEMDNSDAYSPRTMHMDIEKGSLETPKANEETMGSMKTEGVLTHLQKALRRQKSFQIGGKFMQLLMNHGLMLLKFTSRDKPVTERVHDTPNTRWRKYKRAASFDSRKVVLLFSILSSVGTMILIYLTLRVRQIGDGLVHV